MIKKMFCVAILASLLLLSLTQVVAQQYGYGQQQLPGQYGQQMGQQYPQGQYQPPSVQRPPAPQQPSIPPAPQQPSIPPAPPKPVPDRNYGNTDRAAIIGEQLSKSSQDNANVYVSENANRTISLDVYLVSEGDPYELAGTMANLTYMVSRIYSITNLAGSDILLTVYSPARDVITTAKFSDAQNKFAYYNIPESARVVRQPQYGQPPSYGQPAYGQPQYIQPQYGQRPGYGQ